MPAGDLLEGALQGRGDDTTTEKISIRVTEIKKLKQGQYERIKESNNGSGIVGTI